MPSSAALLPTASAASSRAYGARVTKRSDWPKTILRFAIIAPFPEQRTSAREGRRRSRTRSATEASPKPGAGGEARKKLIIPPQCRGIGGGLKSFVVDEKGQAAYPCCRRPRVSTATLRSR